jgi:hypothetical protein
VLGVHEALTPPTAARWGLYGSYDLDTVGFFTPAQTRLVERLRDVEDSPAHLRLLQLGGVDAVIALRPAGWWAALVPVAQVDGAFRDPIRIFGVPGTLPRTYAVSGARIVPDDEGALRTLVDPGFDPAREVVLDAGLPASVQPDFSSTAQIVGQRSDRVTIAAFTSGPGFLVLLGASDPGWRATVDGRAVPVRRANTVFRAVDLPAGAHQVVFSYRPITVAAGALTSALGTVVLVGLAWSRRRTARAA